VAAAKVMMQSKAAFARLHTVIPFPSLPECEFEVQIDEMNQNYARTTLMAETANGYFTRSLALISQQFRM
jgi:hypothetical protein